VFGLLNGDKPALPASRKNCRLRRDALRVIAEGLMKVGKLANSAVDLVGAFRVIAGVHVGFHRLKDNRRKPLGLRVNGLTADDDNFGVTRDSARRADDMFELRTIHKWRCVQCRSERRQRGWTGGAGSRVRIVRSEIARSDRLSR
jgi:hypothetical protein